MSNKKSRPEKVNLQKRSMVMSTLIFVLLTNLLIQIWLLYTALNNALSGYKEVAYSTFVASFILFLGGVIWLSILPKNVN